MKLVEIINKLINDIKENNLNTGVEIDNKDQVIYDLELLKKAIINGDYYTENMLDALFQVVPITLIRSDLFDDIISALYSMPNISSEMKKEETYENKKADINQVIELYKSFLGEKEIRINANNKYIGLFAQLLLKYEDEIVEKIDLENTRKILQFFKEKGILADFDRTALLGVTVYGTYKHIVEVYNEVVNNNQQEMDNWHLDAWATNWIKTTRGEHKKEFRRSYKLDGNKKDSSLYNQCHSVSYEEYIENIKLLNDNADLFKEKYNIISGAHMEAKTMSNEELQKNIMLLKALTSSSWSLRKNILLANMFHMGQIRKIPITSVIIGDIEDKIHLAIELGLFNPPMSLDFDKEIVRNDNFVKYNKKHNIANSSIRDYFQRNTSVLAESDINYYGFLTYKLDTLGPNEFYNYFFSDRIAGKRDKQNIDLDMDLSGFTANKDTFIKEHFVVDSLNKYIPNYDQYDAEIEEYNGIFRGNYDADDTSYYDKSILSDDLIKKLEEKYSVYDIIYQNNEPTMVKNEYVYKIDNKLISRYKVLRNASILKAAYKRLTPDMLLTSMARHSFISEGMLKNIANKISNTDILLEEEKRHR